MRSRERIRYIAVDPCPRLEDCVKWKGMDPHPRLEDNVRWKSAELRPQLEDRVRWKGMDPHPRLEDCVRPKSASCMISQLLAERLAGLGTRPEHGAFVLHWVVEGDRINKNRGNWMPGTGCPSCTIPPAELRNWTNIYFHSKLIFPGQK